MLDVNACIIALLSIIGYTKVNTCYSSLLFFTFNAFLIIFSVWIFMFIRTKNCTPCKPSKLL